MTTTTTRSTLTAMFCAAAVTAQFVSGKATRDALFLTSLDLTALPTMLIATSVCSILLVAAHGRWGAKFAPATFVPAAFVASGLLFVGEWLIRASAPSSTAVFLYLHVSGAGPLLASGFWLLATERFDPRTAKRRFGQISGAGTVGGLLGALLSARAAVWGAPAMLLFLAGLQFLTAWLVRRLAVQLEPVAKPAPAETLGPASAARSGLRVVAEAPHLRHLAALVLLGTTSAALLEYLFKARAIEALGPGDHLLRFFSFYYAATSLVTLILQTLLSGAVLERFGLALMMSTPSIALLAGSVTTLLSPSFGSVVVTRAGESIFRSSWFRSSYELFYTPIPAAEKRAAKSVVDVTFDRLGDAVGGGLIRVAVLLTPVAATSAILWLAVAASASAIVVASRLNLWYLRLLEKSLLKQANGVDVSATADDATRQVLRRIQRHPHDGVPAHANSTAAFASIALDPEILDIISLRSRDHDRIVEVLSREDGVTPGLVPHVVPLLGWSPVADYAFFALRKIAEERIGELADALLDPNQDVVVRRGLASVLSVCVSQRAADSLLLALEDPRFDVRFQAARSLSAVVEKNPRVDLDHDRIYSAVLAEVAVGRSVWEGRRLIEAIATDRPVGEIERDPAGGQSLSHVFTLLSLVLPREPLQIALRGLQSNDRQLRGTALEYLEGVLPARIRVGLWPFVVRRPGARTARPGVAGLGRSTVSCPLRALATRPATGRVAGF